MALAVRDEQERTVSRGGNSSLLYLPKEYFAPGDKLGSRLEIDPEGNLRMVLTKRLYRFSCDDVKALIGEDFKVEYDKTVAGTRILNATRDKVSLSCTKSTRDLEPTRVTVSKLFDNVRSSQEYSELNGLVERLIKHGFDAYMEPEGDLETLNVYRDPNRYKLRDVHEAVEALWGTGKKIGFSVVVRFDGKSSRIEQIKAVLIELKSRVSP